MAYGGIVVFDGNSLTAGNGSTGGNDYPSQVMALLAGYDSYTKYNYGVSGQTTPQMTSDAATQVDILFSPSNAQNILCAWEITNDLFFGASAATAYANFVSYCQARGRAGFQVVALTVLPRSEPGVPGDFETSRQTVNTLLRANWRNFASALADVAADSRIGDAGDELDTNYYDGSNVHLNNAGYAIVAGIAATAILGLPTLTTLTLQPAAAAGKDTMINDGAGTEDRNYGVYASLFIGELNVAAQKWRGLIQFDLSDLPANAIISSAVLSLWLTDATYCSNARTWRVFRMKRSWAEGTGNNTASGDGATWTTYDGVHTWTAPGGFDSADCEQTDIGTRAFSGAESTGAFVNFSLTPTTKDGLDLGYGWMIKPDAESDDAYIFDASDGATAGHRPRLVIEYTLPVAAVALVRAPSYRGRW